MMAVNLGTAGAKEAAEILEYCNMATGTSIADQRVANGHREPYGVKMWCLGNGDGPRPGKPDTSLPRPTPSGPGRRGRS